MFTMQFSLFADNKISDLKKLMFFGGGGVKSFFG